MAVELHKSVLVLREMRRHPVQDHADACSVRLINKILEAVRIAVTGGDAVITRDLIAPGPVVRMLHHRKQLHVGIAHLLHIGDQLVGKLLPVIEASVLMTAPGACVDLINIHRGGIGIPPSPLLLPLLVLPGEGAVNVPDPRSPLPPGRQGVLGIKGIGIGLIEAPAVIRTDQELIELALPGLRDLDLKNAVVIGKPCHRQGILIPVVELADQHHCCSARRPYAETVSVLLIGTDPMRAEQLIAAVILSMMEKILVLRDVLDLLLGLCRLCSL